MTSCSGAQKFFFRRLVELHDLCRFSIWLLVKLFYVLSDRSCWILHCQIYIDKIKENTNVIFLKPLIKIKKMYFLLARMNKFNKYKNKIKLSFHHLRHAIFKHYKIHYFLAFSKCAVHKYSNTIKSEYSLTFEICLKTFSIV